jgi:hypothetical protein
MVGRRTAGVCVIALGMVCVVSGQKEESHKRCLPDAICASRVFASEAVCLPVPPGKDGLIRYTVFINTDDRSQIDAFVLAMDMWNCYSSVTGIRFDRTLDKEKAHLQLQRGKESDDPLNRACAAFEPVGSYVWFAAPLMNWAGSSPKIAARVYAHELGHALALCHLPRKKKASSIMHKGPEHEEKDCRKVAKTQLTDIQLSDAELVRMCVKHVREQCEKDRHKEQLERLLKNKFK